MGLTAFNLRQYDARLGRWQTPDPYGQHPSPYLAMSNNPVSFTDPDGGYDVYDLQEELWASGLGLSASYSNWDDYYDYRDEQDRFNPGYLVDEVQVFYQFQQCYWWEQVTIAKRTEWVYMESEKTDERISVYISRRHKTTGERVFERVWRDAPKRPGYFDGLLSDLGSAFLETTHVALDLIGMVPALGEAADVVNGLIYLAEGDKWNAGISFAGAVAVVGGQAITGARLIKKGADAVGAANSVSSTGTRGYRYVAESEIEAIKNTGMLRGGREGETFYTKDLYKSGSHAQDRLSLPNAPTHRVEFEIINNPSLVRNGTKVEPVGSLPGKGSEFMTTDPVQVKLINVQPLRP